MDTTNRTDRRTLLAKSGGAAFMVAALTGANHRAIAAQSTPEAMLAAFETSESDLQAVAPALAHYRRDTVFGDLWLRPGLSPRDRSVVTLAALITRNQSVELSAYVDLALENGVTPGEISEIITHLAFYSGWENAMGAIAATSQVFEARGIQSDQLPVASPDLLPLDEAAEEQRATSVQQSVGPISQGVVDFTADLLFRDIWLRPDLAPRDRSLITVSALISAGQVEQIPYHLSRAMDNGLTPDEAGEVLTQLAFYAGWPNVFSAIPVVGEVIENRGT